MSYKLEMLPKVARNLSDFERVCAITVALKISDDTCKMDEYEKSVFMEVYKAIPREAPSFFTEDIFEVISKIKQEPSAAVYAEVKNLRESAMEYISRPKMKAFKASIRGRIS